MLTVYADESHDETRQRVFSVAGLLGNAADWSPAKKRWLERTGGKPFHAADCESEYANHPDRQLHKENLCLYGDLAKILAKSNLMGFGAALDLPGWRMALPPKEKASEHAYYKCFSEVVIYFARMACLSVPPERVEFVLDRNLERWFTASKLYAFMATSPDWPASKCLADKMSSATRASPEIQMADLVAREAMKHFDNEAGPVKRPIRRSMQALMASRRFRFEYYMPEYSQQLVASAAKWVNQSGVTAERYRSWLKENRLTDTLAHRIKFVSQSA